MAALTPSTAGLAGTLFSPVSAAAGGDTFVNKGKSLLYVKNGSGSSITVTITAQSKFNAEGAPLSAANAGGAVAAGTERHFGPFPPSIFNTSAGVVAVTYSAVTTVTVGVVSMP